MAKFVFRKKENMTISKPMYFAIGLLVVLLIIGIIFFIFLKYSPIMNFKYEGYAISGKEITENLLGSSEDSSTNKNLELTKIEEQGTIFKKLNEYFVGSKEKKEINLNYPIYINGNSAIYNLAESSTLISKDFEQIAGYPNLSISEGKIYDGNNLERADAKEYIFVKTSDDIFINLYEIKIKTTANEYTIPVNSLLAFTENSIRYYSIKNNVLVFNEINDIDSNSNVQMVENSYTYEDLLIKLRLLQKQVTNTESNKEQTNIIKEDTTTSNTEENQGNEVKQEESTETNANDEQQTQNGYIKPEVSVENFVAEVYTANSTLTIKDPAGRIVEAPTFEIYKDGKIYLRRIFSKSGEIQITGLVPETEYEVVGKFIYLNENNQKVENTFYEGSFTTKGYEELGSIDISKENGEIYSNKIQLTKVKITSDLNAEVVKGINQVEIETGEIRTVLKNTQVNSLLRGEEITIESSEGLKSDSKINYEIKFYDKNGIELKVNNNTGETRTSKSKPIARLIWKEQDIVSVTLRLNLSNRDNVKLENYKYIVTRANGEIVKEERLAENEKEILLENLDQNQYYKIGIYADYDLNDNKGKQENVELGNLVFVTQPISTLGSLELVVENKELTSTTSTISYKIDEDRTDKRLIQILNELTINIKDGENIVKTDTLTEEEISNLQQAETKEIKYENLQPNTTYTIEIIGNVQLGNTQESIPVTYNYKEFTTLKIPAKVEIRNQFVTGNLIDFDVRIEDINNSVLNNEVRMELRNSSNDLIDLQEITTNQDFIRKTYEKLEENQTYKLRFIAEQYNEGSTDVTYKVNYLIQEIEIITVPGITGNIGLTELTRRATGKNLVDVNSDIKWYVYPNFNTSNHYGKEYNNETNILKLGGNSEQRRAVYDLREYAGQEVTMSFKAKVVSGSQTAYIQNSKKDANRTQIQGLTTEWKDFQYTLTVDNTGYLGFYIAGGNGIEVKELQIELGNRKTNYEEFKYTLQSNYSINLEDRRDEITTNDYYIKIYEDNNLVKTDRYEEIPEENIITNAIKHYETQTGKQYKVELTIKINDREYVLSELSYNTKDTEEIKGIYNKEDFLEIQAKGYYIILNDIDVTGASGNTYRFGSNNMEFNGKIDFNGKTLLRDTKNSRASIIYRLGSNGTIENIVADIKLNNQQDISSNEGLIIHYNYGTIRNIQLNIIESTALPNWRLKIITQDNYGTIENFVINMKEPMYATSDSAILCWRNYGVIKNGYIHGKNINAEFTKNSGESRSIGTIAMQNLENGQIKNVYSLISIDLNDQKNVTNNVANIVSTNTQNGSIENVYSVGLGKNITNLNSGPNIYSAGGKISNNYYFNDKVFTNSYHQKTTMLALHDTNFQNQLLNGDNQFNVEECVSKGYYPQIIMSEVMPNQEYISLPEVTDEDLADILSLEVLEQGTNNVKVKFYVHNPSAETITDINVKNISCTILSQSYSDGKSEVIVNLHDPIMYISEYSVLGITTKGAFNLPYTREFVENERVIKVDLYKEIYTIDDWKDINNSPTENYMLMEDLDFINNESEIIISKTYTGKLEGNMHTIKNIRLESSQNGGLFKEVKGEVNNLCIQNLTIDKAKTSRVGLIQYLNTGKVNNVHIKEVKITISTDYIEEAYTAAIVAYGVSGSIQNSSVTNFMLENQSGTSKTAAGGLIAQGNGNNIENCFAQNIDLKVFYSSNVMGIGGIYGYDSVANSIINCYATGIIESDNSNIGGIGGFLNRGDVKECYSTVDIITDGDYTGGLVGNDRNTELNNITNNLVIGNIYNKQEVESTSRVVGNSKDEENNYAYAEQIFNGEITEENEGAILLTLNDLKNVSVYQDRIKLGNGYSYENINNGILPKLYYSNRTELLPNQEDNKLEEEKKLEIEEVVSEKTSVNTVEIRIVVINNKELPISELEIEDMEVKINTNVTRDGRTYLNITATPTGYYDSYRISKIVYKEDNQEKEIEVQGKVNVEFYKEIYNYEDWLDIDKLTYQNYRLMNDIDFKYNSNINTDLCIGKLDGNGHKLENLTINLDKANSGFIKTIKTDLKNITFENINIVNTTSGNITGVIANTSAKVDNIKISNIIVNAPKISQIGFIGYSNSESIQNIVMENIEITGNSYVAGYAGGSYLPIMRTVEANNLKIVGNGNHVAGILSSPTKRDGYNIRNVTVQNSNITGIDYVGGVFANLGGGATNPSQAQHIKSIKNNVTGKNYVGGVASSFYDSSYFESDEVTVKGSGSNIGGIASQGNLSYNVIKNSIIEGTSANSNNVGGLIGTCSWGASNNEVINCTVKSNGSNVGGAYGYYNHSGNGGSSNIYVKGGSVTGYSNVGGIIGRTVKGYFSKCYTDTKIIATSQNAGGIAGYILNNVMELNNIGIRNCYVANSSIESKKNVGGLVGSFSNSLEGGYQYFYNNYIQADLIGDNIKTISLGFGSQKSEIENVANIYVYQYSTINGANITTENDLFIKPAQYLKEADLKNENTYKNKIGWGTNYTYKILGEGKYPLINSSALQNQEGIDLPKDAEHNISGQTSSTLNNGIQVTSINEDNQATSQDPEQTFEYAGKQITTYSDYSIIEDAEGNSVKRDTKLYLKDGNLFVLSPDMNMVDGNFIIDNYNGKEYETVLGTDGKLYDLKEKLTYPENFKNEDIKSIGNNLDTEEKEVEVTYNYGDKIKFNYQTGEIISEEKLDENKTGLIEFIQDKLTTKEDAITTNEEGYEDTKELIQKLEEVPVEKAEEMQNNNEQQENQSESQNTNSTNYITTYNTTSDRYEIYNEEELLNTTKQTVETENEKIAKNDLSSFYSAQISKAPEESGKTTIYIIILAVFIVLAILIRYNINKKQTN